MMSDDHHVWNV